MDYGADHPVRHCHRAFFDTGLRCDSIGIGIPLRSFVLSRVGYKVVLPLSDIFKEMSAVEAVVGDPRGCCISMG
jgi:hypothetical protein